MPGAAPALSRTRRQLLPHLHPYALRRSPKSNQKYRAGTGKSPAQERRHARDRKDEARKHQRRQKQREPAERRPVACPHAQIKPRPSAPTSTATWSTAEAARNPHRQAEQDHRDEQDAHGGPAKSRVRHGLPDHERERVDRRHAHCSIVPRSFSRTIDTAVETTANHDDSDEPGHEEEGAAKLRAVPDLGSTVSDGRAAVPAAS